MVQSTSGLAPGDVVVLGNVGRTALVVEVDEDSALALVDGDARRHSYLRRTAPTELRLISRATARTRRRALAHRPPRCPDCGDGPERHRGIDLIVETLVYHEAAAGPEDVCPTAPRDDRFLRAIDAWADAASISEASR